MHQSSPPSHNPLYICRIAAAVFLAISSLALFLIGIGLSDLLPLPKPAVAESAQSDMRGLPPAVLPESVAMRLRAAVDSAALSLGGVFHEMPFANDGPEKKHNEEAKRDALSRALSALTFGLDGTAYFTAWQGTRVVHSPLAPDASGMDFADALDQRGSAFVLRMEDAAANGGGFVQVTLPRQMALRTEDTRTSVSARPVEQVVYVRKIPESDWHIAAFLPVSSQTGLPMDAAADGDFRKGLYVSSFSLAGLAGLLLIPGRADTGARARMRLAGKPGKKKLPESDAGGTPFPSSLQETARGKPAVRSGCASSPAGMYGATLP